MNSQDGKRRSGAIRAIWEKVQAPEKSGMSLEEKLALPIPRLALAAIAIILALVIALVSFMIYKRSESAMSELLAEMGSSLVNVLESALRTGMTGESGLHLQTLLGEMARSPDIEFVAVAMPDGTIIAHSDRERIGEILRHSDFDLALEQTALLDPGEKTRWAVTEMEGKRVFLVYRYFTMGHKNWDRSVPEPVIFLGINFSPFEITNAQTRSYVTILALVIMLVVFCGLVALSFAQRAAESGRRRRHAEREVRRLEAEVRRNEKLAAVGTLAAGVAHEIRNPLSSIKGYATYFRQRFPEGSEDREAASVMVKEVERLNRVITDLLGLSRPDAVDLKPVSLEYVVEHVMRLLRRDAAERNVAVIPRLARNLAPIMGDMERLSQALLNICINAMEAMPKEGGKLEIAIGRGKNKLCLMTRDNGKGIPPENMGRIFEPYFTTKSSGTGLGLAMVHKIIRAHKGEIEVVSRKGASGAGGGWVTIFRIWLPISTEALEK